MSFSAAITDIEKDVFGILDDITGDFRDIDNDDDESGSSLAKCESSSSDDMAIQPKKRKRGKDFIPRVVKNDVRRYYGTMIMNVLNTCDEDFAKSFFRTYAVPSFRMNMRHYDPEHYAHLPPEVIQNHFPRLRETISFDVDEWMNYHNVVTQVMSSGHVFRLNNVRLVTRAMSKRSIIIMSTELETTRVFDLDTLEVLGSSFSFDQENPAPQRETRIADQLNIEPPKLRGRLTGSVLSARPPMRLLSKPVRSLVKSQMVLVLDANRRIESAIVGDGRPPPDILESLEKHAAALSLQPTNCIS